MLLAINVAAISVRLQEGAIFHVPTVDISNVTLTLFSGEQKVSDEVPATFQNTGNVPMELCPITQTKSLQARKECIASALASELTLRLGNGTQVPLEIAERYQVFSDRQVAWASRKVTLKAKLIDPSLLDGEKADYVPSAVCESQPYGAVEWNLTGDELSATFDCDSLKNKINQFILGSQKLDQKQLKIMEFIGAKMQDQCNNAHAPLTCRFSFEHRLTRKMVTTGEIPVETGKGEL